MSKTPLRMARRLPRPALALLLAAPLALAACSRSGAGRRPAPRAGAGAAAAVSGVGVVAEVNGAPILASELEQKVAGRLARLRQEEYEIRRQALEELIAERLLAAEASKRKLTPEELLRQEVDAKVDRAPGQPRSRRSTSRTRTASPARPGRTRSRASGTSSASARRRRGGRPTTRSCATAARVAVRLEAPRTTVAIPAGAPSTGPADPPVTIVEFTDYQCPYCHRAQAVVDEVLSRYAGKVRFVHLDFPLDGHPGAFPAARAARCAGEQGKFWEYHRSLMTAPGTLDEADLKGRASALRLDAGAFGTCLLVEPSRRRHPGVAAAGGGAGSHGHPGLLRQRPDALRRPADRGVHRADRRRARAAARRARFPLDIGAGAGTLNGCARTAAQEVVRQVAD